MEPKRAFDQLSSEPTATFGVAGDGNVEIVGPMRPKAVHYGVTFASDPDTHETMVNMAFPTVFFDWNKYRPDLPPWRHVREFVLADQDDRDVVEFTFVNTQHRTTSTTGPLKSVSLSADGIYEGVEDAAIIERDEVAEARGMTDSNIRDSQSFKVTEELT